MAKLRYDFFRFGSAPCQFYPTKNRVVKLTLHIPEIGSESSVAADHSADNSAKALILYTLDEISHRKRNHFLHFVGLRVVPSVAGEYQQELVVVLVELIEQRPLDCWLVRSRRNDLVQDYAALRQVLISTNRWDEMVPHKLPGVPEVRVVHNIESLHFSFFLARWLFVLQRARLLFRLVGMDHVLQFMPVQRLDLSKSNSPVRNPIL